MHQCFQAIETFFHIFSILYLSYLLFTLLTSKITISGLFVCFQEYGKDQITIINPAQFPDKLSVSEYLEPTVLGTIVTPPEYIGKIITLCQVGFSFNFFFKFSFNFVFCIFKLFISY